MAPLRHNSGLLRVRTLSLLTLVATPPPTDGFAMRGEEVTAKRQEV